MPNRPCLPASAFALLLGLVLAFPDSGADEQRETEPAPGSTVYRLQPGDTLRELAVRFLGGAKYLPELMAYNGIVNPLGLGAGAFIGIPGDDRKAAMAAIARAHDALQIAAAAQAGTYARGEVATASQSLGAADGARARGKYAEALRLANSAGVTAQKAKRLADERAPVQEPGAVVAVAGQVTVKLPGARTPRPLRPGDPVPVGSIIRTGADSRAEIRLGDGSVVQVLPNSQVQVASYLRDRRDGRRRSRLNVILGNILGKIKKKEHKESTYELKSRASTIAIRGTEVRVGSGQDDVSRLAVLGGDAEFRGAGPPVQVPANFGTYAGGDARPAPPTELLPPPEMIAPESPTDASGKLSYPFAWRPVDSRRFGAYHFELARDAAFNDVQEEAMVPRAKYETGLLAEGDYYWRITTVDTKGLEGRPVQGKLTIGRDMRVVFRPQTQPVVQGDVWVFGPGNLVHVEPPTKATSVVGMEVSLGGETHWRFWEPIGRIRFTYEVSAVLRARGLDDKGNRGPYAEQPIRVDLSPPRISVALEAVPPDPNRADAVLVSCRADDPAGVALIEYGVDGKFAEYVGPFVLPRDRADRLVVRAVDRLGNSSAWLSAPSEQ